MTYTVDGWMLIKPEPIWLARALEHIRPFDKNRWAVMMKWDGERWTASGPLLLLDDPEGKNLVLRGEVVRFRPIDGRCEISGSHGLHRPPGFEMPPTAAE